MPTAEKIQEFQQVSALLLRKHYGLGLGDTRLCEAPYVRILIQGSVRPFEYLNEHADDCNLDRVDLRAQWGIPSQAPLTETEEIGARESMISAAAKPPVSRSRRPSPFDN